MESITFGQVVILLGVTGTIVAMITGIAQQTQRRTKETTDRESAIALLKYQMEQLTKEVHSQRADMHKYVDRLEGQIEKILRRDTD